MSVHVLARCPFWLLLACLCAGCRHSSSLPPQYGIDEEPELAFSSDGHDIVVARISDIMSFEVQIHRWSLDSGRRTDTLLKHPAPGYWGSSPPDPVRPAGWLFSLSADGRFAVSAGFKTVIWDTRSGKPLYLVPTRVNFPFLSADGELLVLPNGEKSPTLTLIEVASGRTLTRISGEEPVFSANHHICAVHDSSNGITVFRLWPSTKELTRVKAPVRWKCGACTLSPDGRDLICQCYQPNDAAQHGSLLIDWDTATGKIRRQHGIECGFACFHFSQDGTKVAAADGKTLRVWNTVSGGKLMSVNRTDRFLPPPWETPVWQMLYRGTLAFSPDGKTIAAARDDHRIHLWTTDAGAELTTLQLPRLGQP